MTPPPPPLWRAGWLGLACALCFASPLMAQASPLPPCPAETGCCRASLPVTMAPDAAFAYAERAVRRLFGLTIGWPTSVEVREGRRLHAAFRVYAFTDDLALAVDPAPYGAIIHIRSASRVGRGDLGVNRRRVRALIRVLDRG